MAKFAIEIDLSQTDGSYQSICRALREYVDSFTPQCALHDKQADSAMQGRVWLRGCGVVGSWEVREA